MGLLEIISTPERREQARKEQIEAREKFGARLAKHPAQANYLYGMAREQQALDQLAVLPRDGGENEAHALNQLAEGLALQGRFEEAAEVCQSEPHKQEYLAKADALSRVGIGCQCPPTIVSPSPRDAKGTTSQAQPATDEVYDGTAVIQITKCTLCGTVAANIG